MTAFPARFTRYVLAQLLIGTTALSAVLVFIVWLTQSLRFLQFVMGKGLPLVTWLKLTVLMMPPTLALILPIALFTVTLFVYNKLTVDRELVVVQAAGLSRLGLATPALAAGVAAVLLGYVLSLAAVPAAMRAFKDLQWSIRNDVSQVLLREGAFNQLTPDLTVYVRGNASDGALVGLLIHDTRDPTTAVTLMAERGTVEKGENGAVIRLINGSRQQRAQNATELSVLTFDSYAVELGRLADAGENRWLDNGERTTRELLSQTEADGHSATTVRRMRADAHQRLTSPLLNVAFGVVALAWLLCGPFDRKAATMRMLAATATVIVLQVATLGVMALAATQTAWLVALYALALLPIAAGLYVLGAGASWAPVEFARRMGLPNRARGKFLRLGQTPAP